MWILDPPSASSVRAQLKSALTPATPPPVHVLTGAEYKAIRALYALYEAQEGQPSPGLKPTALAACEDILRDCYDQVQIGGRLEKLREQILSGADECPLCGYGDPTTLDHYLPRSRYKALAIFPRNLVPACQPCNRKKGTGVPSGARGFIHAYYEELEDDEPFLHADVTYARAVLQVVFRVDHLTLPQLTIDRLRHQLDKLKLNKRYTAPINTFLFGQKVSLLSFKGPTGPARRRRYIEKVAADWANNHGLNDWRSALLRGLAKCPRFCAKPEAYFQENKPRRRRRS